MAESDRLADYFVVVEADDALELNRHTELGTPIVDIVMILAATGEKPPPGYTAVRSSMVHI